MTQAVLDGAVLRNAKFDDASLDDTKLANARLSRPVNEKMDTLWLCRAQQPAMANGPQPCPSAEVVFAMATHLQHWLTAFFTTAVLSHLAGGPAVRAVSGQLPPGASRDDLVWMWARRAHPKIAQVWPHAFSVISPEQASVNAPGRVPTGVPAGSPGSRTSGWSTPWGLGLGRGGIENLVWASDGALDRAAVMARWRAMGHFLSEIAPMGPSPDPAMVSAALNAHVPSHQHADFRDFVLPGVHPGFPQGGTPWGTRGIVPGTSAGPADPGTPVGLSKIGLSNPGSEPTLGFHFVEAQTALAGAVDVVP